MSQRNSGYARQPNDTYVTPRWVYEALYSVKPWAENAWDCAPVNADFDFLSQVWTKKLIATNPPFSLADEFCRHALRCATKVAMLLPMEFDCAKGRKDLFADNGAFQIKLTLTKRIRWENLVQKSAGPSKNHAWYVWDHDYELLWSGPRMGWL